MVRKEMAAGALPEKHEWVWRALGKKGKEFYTEVTENAESTEKTKIPEEKSRSEEETERRRGRLSAW